MVRSDRCGPEREILGHVILAVLAITPVRGQPVSAADSVVALSLSPITIYRDSTRYNSFPDIARLPDGRLLCVFRDAAYPERIRHIESDARVVGCVSKDDGRTWSKPEVIYDDPACQNDPSVAVLRDGRMLLCLTGDNHVVVAYYMNGKGTSDRWNECKRIPLAMFR